VLREAPRADIFPDRRRCRADSGVLAVAGGAGLPPPAGVPADALYSFEESCGYDNPSDLIRKHDHAHQVLVFNDKQAAVACYWGVFPRASRHYRGRTNGTDERSVGSVTTQAVAGSEFAIWEALKPGNDRRSYHAMIIEQPLVFV
jgi:hypothetical protein